MTRMLASVRDAAEAELVLACDADWIDVKEPSAGALGAAAPAVVRGVIALVGGRRPVSATIGDDWTGTESLERRIATMAATGVDYVKAGLDARALASADRARVAACAARYPGLIIVCMAEQAPTASAIEALLTTGVAGLMLDTADKTGARLTRLLDQDYLAEFVVRTRAHGCLCGLAGRLRLDDIASLVALGADYLGFRSALCEQGGRTGSLVREAVLDVRRVLSRAAGEVRSTIESEVT